MERKRWTLLANCIAIFTLLLDVTIVNVALPSIERDLWADFSDLQWVIDAYALSLAGLVLAAGSLADRVGRRLVFMLGLAIFTAWSLACGRVVADVEGWLEDQRCGNGSDGTRAHALLPSGSECGRRERDRRLTALQAKASGMLRAASMPRALPRPR